MTGPASTAMSHYLEPYATRHKAYLMAVDPGFSASSGTGWAFFDRGALAACGVITPKSTRLAEKIEEIRNILDDVGRMAVRVFVIEIPRVYPGPRQKGDQNDIIDLAVVAGALIAPNASEKLLVHPRTWAGTVPKKIRHERLLRKESEGGVLSAAERARFPGGAKAHNAFDAVGIGLWAIGRGR